MTEINLNEQKIILVEILKYIDSVCRENNIKYTLVCGTLIGAIRHKGFIPWDDDIDIGLVSSEYDKLIDILSKSKNDRFKLLDINNEPSYYYPFAKVVDSYTCGYEMCCKKIKGYGIYVDIFKYNTIPDKEKEVEKYYTELQKIKHKLSKSVYNDSKYFLIKILRKLRYFVNSKKIAKKYIKYTEKYNGKDYNNVMTNWPVYGAKNDTLCRNSFEKYEDVKFENITAMIVSDYDTILKKTFGDYLKLPPKEEQISHHHMKMYRKDSNEK